MTDKKHIDYFCDECDSTAVVFDSYAQWNVDKQEMEVVSTYDKGHHCNNCDMPTSPIEKEVSENEPYCQYCFRLEHVCSENPCDDVIVNRST